MKDSASTILLVICGMTLGALLSHVHQVNKRPEGTTSEPIACYIVETP